MVLTFFLSHLDGMYQYNKPRRFARRPFCQWLLALVMIAFHVEIAAGQFLSGYSPLPGFSENSTSQRLGDSYRYRKAQANLSGQVRPQDEIWLISTRDINCKTCTANPFSATKVARWCSSQWQPSNPGSLIDAINEDPERENVVFIHGNRTDLQWASLRGYETYESIVWQPESSGCTTDPAPPIRWIIWAWCSDPLHGPRHDLAVKRQRAVNQGPCLADFFSRLQCPRLGVITYSLGAQALLSAVNCEPTGAADLAATDHEIHLGPQLRVVMLAAAVPACWFRSAKGQDCIKRRFAQFTLINNPHDRVLEAFRRFTGQQPLGIQATQVASEVHSEVYLLSDRSLDNHFLSQYLLHSQTRFLIRAGVLFDKK